MLHMIIGGSGSGKSEYAEKIAYDSFEAGMETGRLIYIATMYPYSFGTDTVDDESAKKIDKHRKMRAGKGFVTCECYTDIVNIDCCSEDVLLLECISNLLANELYLKDGKLDTNTSMDNIKKITDKQIIEPILKLTLKAKKLIVVTNEIFSDLMTESYDEETELYVNLLGYINSELAKKAKIVTEVFCGIPIVIKNAEEN